MLQYIDPFYFFIALFIGLFFAYISTPIPDIVIKYPTPENAGKIIYRDSGDVCYKYRAEEVECPSDKSKVKRIGIQYVDNDDKNNQNIVNKIKSAISPDHSKNASVY